MSNTQIAIHQKIMIFDIILVLENLWTKLIQKKNWKIFQLRILKNQSSL